MGTQIGTGYIATYLDNKGIENNLGALGQELGSKFGPIGATAGQVLGTNIGKGVKSGTDDASEGVTSLSGLLDAAGPWGIAAGAAVVGAGAVGTALYKMGSDFETQYRTIARNTGATGSQLSSLEGSFRSVASTSSSSFGQVTTAIDEVQRYTGPAGKQLDTLSSQFLTLSRITGTDVAGNVEAGVHALENWNVPAAKAPGYLNELFTASQKSGVSFSSLAGSVTKFGPSMRTLGISFTDTTAMLAEFGKTGVNSQAIMAALQMGASKLSKQQETDTAAVTKAQGQLDAANLKLATSSGKQLPAAHAAVTKATLALSAAQEKAKASSGDVGKAMQDQIASIKNAKNGTDALADRPADVQRPQRRADGRRHPVGQVQPRRDGEVAQELRQLHRRHGQAHPDP